jgi:YD repeat-containing protein
MKRMVTSFLIVLTEMIPVMSLHAFVPCHPLSVIRSSKSGLATVAFGPDLAALMSSITNEAGACVSRVLRDIPARTVTETDITGQDTVTCSDTAGRVTSVTRPDGVLVSNVLDVLGRPVSVLHNGVTVLGIDWRPDGTLLAASNAAASLAWSHNAFGLATNEAAQVSSFEFQVSRSLNAASLPMNTTLSVESCELSVERSYDPAGRLVSLTTPAGKFAFSYDGTHGLPRVVSNAALSVIRSYDALGRVMRILHRAGPTSLVFMCEYDGAGLVGRKRRFLTGGRTR